MAILESKNYFLRMVKKMPIIVVEAGMLEKESKNELIRKMTSTASEITKIPESSYTVLIKENPIDNWGVGGEPLAEIFKRRNQG
jgi:4-oxalocrotonate tautomerase